jgi:hypothetical protein
MSMESGTLRIADSDALHKKKKNFQYVDKSAHLFKVILLKDTRFQVLTAVSMKNAVFCDIKTQLVPHRKYITSPLQSSAG